MPGFIKVNGEQRPIAVPYVKDAGTWKPIALGYTKVNGEWKIWYTAEVKDNFNRANNATLGTASDNFSFWSQSSSAWTVANNAAQHNGGAGPDIAFVPLYKVTTDVTAEADLLNGTGLGIAFWVADTNNWWAAIPGRRTQNNPAFYSCPEGYDVSGDRCIRTVRYPATDVPPSTVTVRSCPAGYSDTGSDCVFYSYPVETPSNIGVGCRGFNGCANLGGICYYSQVCNNLNLGSCNCVIPITNCSCFPGGGPCDETCGRAIVADYIYSTVTDPGGWSCLSGGVIETYNTNPPTCVRNDNIAATYNPPTTTYPSVIRVYRNVGGSITSQFESDVPSDPASIQVVAVGNNVNVRLYSQALVQGSPYASRSFTASNPNRGTRVGIIKYLNQAQGQGTRLDNFRAE